MDDLIIEGLRAASEHFENGSIVQNSACLGISIAGVAHFGLKVYEDLD